MLFIDDYCARLFVADWSKTATNNTKKVSSDNLGKSLSSSSFSSSTANWTSKAKATLNPFTKRHTNTGSTHTRFPVFRQLVWKTSGPASLSSLREVRCGIITVAHRQIQTPGIKPDTAFRIWLYPSCGLSKKKEMRTDRNESSHVFMFLSGHQLHHGKKTSYFLSQTYPASVWTLNSPAAH